MPMNHKIFLAQFDAIKKLAGEGPCVMVGRCADYALADWNDCFSIFVHADLRLENQQNCIQTWKNSKRSKRYDYKN